MATKYDVFELLYIKNSVLKPSEVAALLKTTTSNYHAIYQVLLELEKNKLIKRTEEGFQCIYSKKHDILYKLISYCIANGINYNDLLMKNIAAFISKALRKRRFTMSDFNINPRTFTKYIEILSKNGLLIVFSKKPVEASIPYNSFLRDFLHYFNYESAHVKTSNDECIMEIEKELIVFKRLKKKNERKYQEIIEKYEIRFVQHSLNLEGNPITLPETKKILEQHIIPPDVRQETIEEVQDYQKAVQQMLLDANNSVTKETIIKYHYLAMRHKPEFAGKVRNISVHIRNNPNFKVTDVKDIETKLQLLLQAYNEFSKKKKNSLTEVLEFSAYFHNEFQHIHPFIDGNSRTTRLLTFHLLRANNIPIIDIPLGLLEEYLFATKGAKKRNDKELKQVLQRIILYNLKNINEQLE